MNDSAPTDVLKSIQSALGLLNGNSISTQNLGAPQNKRQKFTNGQMNHTNNACAQDALCRVQSVSNNNKNSHNNSQKAELDLANDQLAYLGKVLTNQLTVKFGYVGETIKIKLDNIDVTLCCKGKSGTVKQQQAQQARQQNQVLQQIQSQISSKAEISASHQTKIEFIEDSDPCKSMFLGSDSPPEKNSNPLSTVTNIVTNSNNGTDTTPPNCGLDANFFSNLFNQNSATTDSASQLLASASSLPQYNSPSSLMLDELPTMMNGNLQDGNATGRSNPFFPVRSSGKTRNGKETSVLHGAPVPPQTFPNLSALKIYCKFKYCNSGMITHAPTVTSKLTGKTYPVPELISCKDMGVYCIECIQPNCKFQAITQTNKPFREQLRLKICYFKQYMEGIVDSKNRKLDLCTHYKSEHLEICKVGLTLDQAYKVTYLAESRNFEDLAGYYIDWKKKLMEPEGGEV